VICALKKGNDSREMGVRERERERDSFLWVSVLIRVYRLLVLDLDNTLMHNSYANSVQDAVRPGVHELLSAAYPFYDICIWSQTSWRWLEAKITEMGLLFCPQYAISFVLDRLAMTTVTVRKKQQVYERSTVFVQLLELTRHKVKKHSVKPLELVWRKFPDHFSPKNTIHVDDLSKNVSRNMEHNVAS